jgi:hypothetical protein
MAGLHPGDGKRAAWIRQASLTLVRASERRLSARYPPCQARPCFDALFAKPVATCAPTTIDPGK